VCEKKLAGQEMFVPLAHPPGDAQADFGEALVVINGVQCKAHYLVVDLPHSDDGFVKAFPAETTEAFCEGHNAAFRYFGGVPRLWRARHKRGYVQDRIMRRNGSEGLLPPPLRPRLLHII
jgi:transposase